MPNPNSIAQQISLFRSRIQNRSFDDVTVRVLESILASKDVPSLIRVRSALRQFMRDESLLIVGEIVGESVEIKLMCADFLIRVFALIGDVESCLAFRYEALVMRDRTTHPGLQVTCEEWLTLAEHSQENGFHSIANQVCEKALMCSKANHVAQPEMNDLLHDVCAIEKIKRLKVAAVSTISSRSVEAQAEAHMKQKKVEQSTHPTTISTEAQTSGSSRFRSGIREHNLRKLHNYRCG